MKKRPICLIVFHFLELTNESARNMDYLILLNKKYPYRNGETFLENEIEEIAKYFDKILIYPSDPVDDEKQTRIIKSDNVDVRVLSLKKNVLLSMLKNISGVLRCLKRSREHGLHKIIDTYYLFIAMIQAKSIIDDLNGQNFKSADRIFIYSYWLYTSAIVACNLREELEKSGIRSVIFSRAHRFDIYEEKRFLSFLPQRVELLKNLDCIFACSEDGASYLKSKYPEYADKIYTSYLGTYDRGINVDSNGMCFHIVSCSRVTKIKRVDLIVDALEKIRNSGVQFEWTHLGGGKLLDRLKRKAAKLEWMKVDFSGQVSNKDIYNFYLSNQVDLFINVSSSEGLPVSIMEAISFGIPVIATDVGGTREIVQENISGSLINVDFTINELASLIMKYARMNLTKRKKIRETTRELWEKKFEAELNYKEFALQVKRLAK